MFKKENFYFIQTWHNWLQFQVHWISSSSWFGTDEGIKTTHTLFPCPHPVYGKGVLVQGTLWGNLILGPTARDTMKKDKESGKYIINQDVANESRDNIMGYVEKNVKKISHCGTLYYVIIGSIM